jgi:hypothetical protein
MKNFWRVRYYLYHKTGERESDIKLIFSFEGKPVEERIDNTDYTLTVEYFDATEEKRAYSRMKNYQLAGQP